MHLLQLSHIVQITFDATCRRYSNICSAGKLRFLRLRQLSWQTHNFTTVVIVPLSGWVTCKTNTRTLNINKANIPHKSIMLLFILSVIYCKVLKSEGVNSSFSELQSAFSYKYLICQLLMQTHVNSETVCLHCVSFCTRTCGKVSWQVLKSGS